MDQSFNKQRPESPLLPHGERNSNVALV